MFVTNRFRLSTAKYAYLETALIILGFMFIAYMIDPKDPVLINYGPVYLTLILVTITLFHGIGHGLFAMFLLSMAMKYFYAPFPTVIFLKLSILVLILGEFHYFWNRKIAQNSSKNAYLRTKLDELSNAFYTLKISHDQLEKNYVFKPMSLRNSIRILKDSYIKGEDYNKEFLTLLQKSFNVSEAVLYAYKDEKFYMHDDHDFKDPIKEKDPMVEMALVKKSPIYVSSSEVQNNSKYLAAIPAVAQGKVKGVLLITKMPFLSFNKDTLITISVLIAYFLDEFEKWKCIDKEADEHIIESSEYLFEQKRLYKLYKEFEVESTVLVLKTEDELLAHLISEKVKSNLRSLDIKISHKVSDTHIIGVLFPFADEASAKGFLSRLFKLLKLDENDNRLELSFFDIAELQSINRYMELVQDDA